jgi:hypothetical protein
VAPSRLMAIGAGAAPTARPEVDSPYCPSGDQADAAKLTPDGAVITRKCSKLQEQARKYAKAKR